MTPQDVHEEIRSSGKRILVGKLKLFPPGGKTRLSRKELRAGRFDAEQAIVQQFEVEENGKREVLTILRPGSQLHTFLNRYFAKPLDREGAWIFLGESNDAANLFTIKLPELDVGNYVFLAIVTGNIGDYSYLAEDSLIVEITE